MQGSGFRVQGAGCRVHAGCRVQGAGCRVQGAGFRVQGAGCRVQGAGCRDQGSTLLVLALAPPQVDSAVFPESGDETQNEEALIPRLVQLFSS